MRHVARAHGLDVSEKTVTNKLIIEKLSGDVTARNFIRGIKQKIITAGPAQYFGV